MALNAALRKHIRKSVGASLQVQLEADNKERELPADFMECLADEPAALEQYHHLSKAHKSYFTNWITGVKSEAVRAKRMAQAVTALAKGYDFLQMVRALKKEREDLKNSM